VCCLKGVTREIISMKPNMEICPSSNSATIFVFSPHWDQYGRHICVCVSVYYTILNVWIDLNETSHAISMLQQAFFTNSIL
jgi:hypothetical protein